ncbi:Development/cell death domain containing protein [Trema orientale]|uniref:Development/cell death domain containing protein n=1 Tax=Trema orientale TaxID=63057 RepID=A0A2P5E5T6_TREOI|nr:Development/cell death domain containing protein [Trema orientale]
MGAGRDTQTQTFWFKEKAEYQETSSFDSTFRNLGKNDLKAVIFGCNHTTIEEYYSQQLFELPDPHFTYVRNIDPGLPLLLFNYRNRRLYGVFEAASDGSMNISPYAWSEDEYEYTTLCPAQVKVKIRMRCQPLVDDDFGPVITENYYESGLFGLNLTEYKQRN